MTFQMTQMLDVTDLAAEKAKSLLVEKGFADGALRVFVVGGGCSGYQYGDGAGRPRRKTATW